MPSQKDLNANNSDVNNNDYLNSNDYYCYNKHLYAKIISNCENKFNILTNNTIGICDICKHEFYCGNELLVFDSAKVLNEYIEGVLNYKKDIVCVFGGVLSQIEMLANQIQYQFNHDLTDNVLLRGLKEQTKMIMENKKCKKTTKS